MKKPVINVGDTFTHVNPDLRTQAWTCERLPDTPNGYPVIQVIGYTYDPEMQPYHFETEEEWFNQRGLTMGKKE